LNNIWESYIKCCEKAPAPRTFVEWVGCGKKFARLAAAGSIYILVIISGLSLRWKVAKAHSAIVNSLADMVRDPHRAPERRFKADLNAGDSHTNSALDSRNLITSCIIPTLSRMCNELPLQFEVPNLESLDCTDLKASDCLFDRLETR